MKKSKILLSAILTIALCVSLITGATMALFTSESSVNIAVTSGKVHVVATLGEATPYYKIDGEEEVSGSFGNSGTSVEVKDDSVILNNIVPYDGVRIPIKVVNESNVAIKYQVRITSSMTATEETPKYDLFDALEYSVDLEFGFTTLGKTSATDWQSVEAGGKIVNNENDTMTLNIYFPDAEDNNDYQGLSGNLALQVIAVQSNANTTNPSEVPTTPDEPEKTSYVFDFDQLAEIEEQFSSGENYENKTIFLMDDIKLDSKEWTPIAQKDDVDADGKVRPFKGTFDGQNHTITGLLVSQGSDGGDAIRTNEDAGLFGITNGATIKNLNIDGASVTAGRYAGALVGQSNNTTIENVHIKNAVVKGAHFVGALSGYANSGFKAINCTVNGCVVDGTNFVETAPNNNYNTGDKVGAIVGQVGGTEVEITGCTVSDTTITAWRDLGSIAGMMNNESGKYTVKDNTITNVTLVVNHVDGDKLPSDSDRNANVNTRKVIGRYSGTVDPDTQEANLEKINKVSDVQIKLKGVDYLNIGKNYYVANVAGLKKAGEDTNDGTVAGGEGKVITIQLTEDITFGEEDEIQPINGHYINIEGNGHTLYNLKAGHNSVDKSGLVSYLGGGVIRNLTINGATVSGSQSGVFAGQLEGGSIENCVLAGNITVTYKNFDDNGYNESHNGIGIFAGVINTAGSKLTGTIAEDCVITLDFTDFDTQIKNVTDDFIGGYYLSGKPTIEVVNNAKTETTVNGLDYYLSGDDWHIFTDKGLFAVAENYNKIPENDGNKGFPNRTIFLEKDVDLNNKEWTPIGAENQQNFRGTFDGKGHKIQNLKVARSDGYDGFFARVSNGTIKNVIFENADVSGGSYTGVVVGRAGSSGTPNLNNITIQGNVKVSGGAWVGALVGHMIGNFSDIKVDVEAGSLVKGTYGVGGIIGTLSGSDAELHENLYTNIDVTASGGPTTSGVGAVIGRIQGNVHSFKNVKAYGSVTMTNENGTAGAFASRSENESTDVTVTVDEFEYKGTITGGIEIGEFVTVHPNNAKQNNFTFNNSSSTITRDGVTTTYTTDAEGNLN